MLIMIPQILFPFLQNQNMKLLLIVFLMEDPEMQPTFEFLASKLHNYKDQQAKMNINHNCIIM